MKEKRDSIQIRKGLYPSEWLVLGGLIVMGLLYLILGLQFRNPVGFYLMQLKAIAMFFPFALFLAFLFLLLRDGYQKKREGKTSSEKEVWTLFRRFYLSPASLVKDFRLLNVGMLTFVLFGHLKHLIPVINGSLWDAPILEFERWVLGGKVAFELMDRFIPRSAAPWISHGYESYYVYFAMALFLFALQRKSRRLGEQFFFAFALLWIIGVIVTYLVPTWGPCFYVPEIYVELPETVMRHKQNDLWLMKLALDKDPHDLGAIFAISGLPSMHLAVIIMGSIYLHRLNILLAIASWVVVAVTVVSTLYFGWHYILDDIASVFLVLFVLWVTGAVYRWLEAFESEE